MVLKNKRNYTSLRLILIIWFFVFSIVPLGLVSLYSVVKFKKAIETEQLARLSSNAREIEVMYNDFYNSLKNFRDQLITNPYFTFNVTTGDQVALKEFLESWVDKTSVSHIAIYNRDGKKISHAEKEYFATLSMHNTTQVDTILKSVISHLNKFNDYGYINKLENGIELVLVSKIVNSKKKHIGYIKQKYLIKHVFMNQIKNNLKVEMILVDDKFTVINSTLPDWERINLKQLLKLKKSEPEQVVDIQAGKESYSFIAYNARWDQSPLRIVIGTNKKESLAVLNEINMAYLGVTGLGVLVLVVTILISTSVFLKPVRQLIESLKSFDESDALVQLRVKNKTEIGLLITTFNQMSLKVHHARNDLKTKIKELQKANSELKEAQAQLVQSAKMTSLGQLVAGVAHELNNPIGFIYSNTTHLREYSEKLFSIIEQIEKNPHLAKKIKADNEFEYIQQDLPRLIKSCQDGAQRTRDIVLGLRNFSRLEESQLKDIDLHAAIEMTLELLRGEIKNRIEVVRQFDTLPLVHCYASQINQVVMNILSNAVHAINGQGEIWITTRALKNHLNIVDVVQIVIKDTGMGMSPEVVDKIFEPFFTTKEVGQGTGLGLSISYGIIQNHGGSIKVKSQINEGTEFTITIPVKQSKAKK